MGLSFSFGNDFIFQKVSVRFYEGVGIYETFEEYLDTRTVEELRRLERRLEKNFTGKWQVRFDDYSRLVNRNGRVYVYIQYPNDEDEREESMSTEDFFEVLVKFNIEYDMILITKGKHHIGPRARSVIENMSWVPYSLKKEPETGRVHILFPEGCFAAFKACLENRSEEELKTIAAAAGRAYDTREEDYREDLSWDDGSGLCFSHETTEARKREERDGTEQRSAMRTREFVELVKSMLGEYKRMRKEQEKKEKQGPPMSEEEVESLVKSILEKYLKSTGPKSD